MELEYRLKLKDYQEACYARIKKKFVFIIIASIYLFLKGVIELTELDFAIGITNIFLGISYCPFLVIFQNFIMAKKWKKQHTLHKPINISVNSEQIKLKSESFNFIGKWSYYYHYKESKNLFLIYSSDHSLHIVPKRAFENSQAIDDFSQLLKAKVGKTQANLNKELPLLKSYPCHFSYQLNFQDCLKAEREILRSQPFVYISLWIGSILLLGISGLILSSNSFPFFGLALIMLLFSSIADKITVIQEPMLSLLGFLSSSFIFGFIFIYGLLINPSLGVLTKWEASRKWKYTPSLWEPQTIGINDTGITTHSPSVELFATWDSYQDYREKKNYFILYTLYPHLFKIYPKRAFENNQDLEVFCQLLASKVDTNIVNYN